MTTADAEIYQLRPHERFTVDECMSYCAMEQEDYAEVMVISISRDDQLVVRSSAMSRAEALWLIEKAREHALDR